MSSVKKEKILEAAIFLIENSPDFKDVTTRAIAERSAVNPAMINYYYGSKDALLVLAIRFILEDFLSDAGPETYSDVKSKLEEVLIGFLERILSLRDYVKASVPDILIDDEIILSNKVYPYIRAYHGDGVSDRDCRLFSYRLMSFILLAIYRADDVRSYCDIDISDPIQARKFIKSEIDLILN